MIHFLTQGIILLPTTVPLGQPLECTFCSSSLMCGHDHGPSGEDPGHNALFVRKHCHQNMHWIILYYPFILLIMSAVLVIIDRPFTFLLFKSENCDTIYKALVEDGEVEYKDRQIRQHHLKNVLMNSTASYHKSYIFRTFFSLVIAGLFIALLSLFTFST